MWALNTFRALSPNEPSHPGFGLLWLKESRFVASQQTSLDLALQVHADGALAAWLTAGAISLDPLLPLQLLAPRVRPIRPVAQRLPNRMPLRPV